LKILLILNLIIIQRDWEELLFEIFAAFLHHFVIGSLIHNHRGNYQQGSVITSYIRLEMFFKASTNNTSYLDQRRTKEGTKNVKITS